MLESSFYVSKNTLIVRLKGELDQNETDDLRIRINELMVKYNIVNIIFNLRELEFMDSSGIGIIIGRYCQIKNKGQIVLCEINRGIQKLISLSGLVRICKIKDSEQTALCHIGGNR